MFGKREKGRKKGEKLKKVVDTGGCFVVFYPSAREKLTQEGVLWYSIQALERRGTERVPRGRENLENDTERLEETTVNSEMSFT